MRSGRPLVCLVLLGVVLTGVRIYPAPVRAQEIVPDPRLILAFYYAWFDWSTWTSPVCDTPTQLYVSADMGAVARHVEAAQGAGIDAFVQAWYGPSLAGNPTEPNLAMLLEQAGRVGFKAAVMVDMTGEHLQTAEAVAAALTSLRETHAAHPAYLHYEGRPVVFFLGQKVFSLPAWEALRNRVDPAGDMLWIAQGPSTEYLEIFDGLFLYDAVDGAFSAAAVGRRADDVRKWSAEHAAARLWVATVLPGYDDSSAVAADAAILRVRRSGAEYSESWAAAAASDPDWIAIRSYNEWTHCTHVEPSAVYGEVYLGLTTDLVTQYRYPATPTPTSTLPPEEATATPTLEPAQSTPEPGATATLTPTVVPAPTVTLTPTATPFRLSTPTPTPAAGEGGPGDPVRTAAPLIPVEGAGPAPRGTATPFVVPRLPVEGAAPRRCSLLPALLPLLGALGVRGGRVIGRRDGGCASVLRIGSSKVYRHRVP